VEDAEEEDNPEVAVAHVAAECLVAEEDALADIKYNCL
jgi:hypothetical protein